MSAALDALAWICGEGQRNCEYVEIGLDPCPALAPDDPAQWCDVCIAGAVWYAAVTTRRARLCASCGHLYSEHYHRAVLLDDNCSCCDCPDFIDEPDYTPLDSARKESA